MVLEAYFSRSRSYVIVPEEVISALKWKWKIGMSICRNRRMEKVEADYLPNQHLLRPFYFSIKLLGII